MLYITLPHLTSYRLDPLDLCKCYYLYLVCIRYQFETAKLA